ncbi:PAS domain S-box protein [Tahibacter amnicola]|uniref:histidine kinase n=1 Tax=Tahibacter amnicola TaxID=2976241 RepID=A0ABY6BJL4_9GAMM|nr:PAS domain S-box protein [Tahibacter amnicola]UXI70206.1 PAS domain S-box protein [Tahibacter amnicola]
MHRSASLLERASRVARLAGLVIAAVGISSLLAWFAGSLLPSPLGEALRAIRPGAALCVLLAGTALVLHVRSLQRQWETVCVAMLLAIVVATAVTYVVAEPDIDQWLALEKAGGQRPLRMGLASTFCFALIGIALALSDVSWRGFRPAQWCCLLCLWFSIVALTGMAFGAAGPRTIPVMANVTALAALSWGVLSIGILLSRPQVGIMRLLTSDTSSGYILRRLLPAMVLIAIVVESLSVALTYSGVISNEFGKSLSVAVNITYLCVLVWWVVAPQARLELAQRQTTAALADSEENLAITLDSIGDAVIATGPSGIIQRMNPVAERLTGWAREEGVGRPLGEVLRLVDERTGDVLESPVARVLREAHPVELGRAVLLLPRHGDPIPISDSGAPIRSGTNEVRGVVLVFRDRTDEHRAELEIRKLAEIVDYSTDAIIRKDASGTITHWNRGAVSLFGYSAAEAVGQSIDLLLPVGAAEERSRIMARRMANSRMEPFETVRRHKDGHEVAVSVAISPIDDGYGNVVGSSMIARDISERQRAAELRERTYRLEMENARVEESNRLKSEFLANMSHELRTPLNAIIGFTGTLLMRLPGPLTGGQEKQLTTIQQSARHLLSLINDLLDLAKIEAGKIDLHPELIDCRNIIDDVMASLRPEIVRKGLSMTVNLPELDAWVTADRRAATQILLNLAGNAVKFTERGGVTISVEQTQSSGQVRTSIAVQDTGPGIERGDLPKLFVAYGQLDSSSTRRHEGTGLGLRLSQKLAELMGGTIWVESVVGQGSCFRFEWRHEACMGSGIGDVGSTL